MKAPTETDLLRQCLGLLRLHGIFAWRGNAGGGLRNGRPIVGNPEGTPDILLTVPVRCFWCGATNLSPAGTVGRLVGVECKSATGRQRPAQKAWQKNAEAVGILYWIIRDVKELETLLRNEGAIR